MRLTLAANADVAPETLEALTHSGDVATRVVLAQQPWLPHKVALRLSSDPTTDVRRSLAEVTAFADVLDLLLADRSTTVRCVSARSPSLTAEQVLRADGIPKLEFWPLGHPVAGVHIERRGDVRYVTGHSAALHSHVRRLEQDRTGRGERLEVTEEMQLIYRVLLRDMVLAVADHLSLSPPPHHLAPP